MSYSDGKTEVIYRQDVLHHYAVRDGAESFGHVIYLIHLRLSLKCLTSRADRHLTFDQI